MSLSSMAQLASARLTKLNLTGSDWWLSVDAVAALAKCTTLQTLFLSTNNSVRDAALCAIAANCVSLTQLDLSNCRRVTDVGIAALATLPLLHNLELANCPGTTDDALCALAARAGRPMLYLGLRSASASEAALSELTASCTSLTHLNIGNCDGASDATLAAISRSCPELRVLELRQSDECTDAGLIALAAGCTKLEELLLDGCTDALTDKAVDTILQGLKQLHTLSAVHLSVQ